MTTEQKLELIKEECREAIRLGEAATAGPWKARKSRIGTNLKYVAWKPKGDKDYEGGYGTAELLPKEADFIAHARTFSPSAARALLVAIETFETLGLHDSLERIAGEWNAEVSREAE